MPKILVALTQFLVIFRRRSKLINLFNILRLLEFNLNSFFLLKFTQNNIEVILFEIIISFNCHIYVDHKTKITKCIEIQYALVEHKN